jgi:hypothetical protein
MNRRQWYRERMSDAASRFREAVVERAVHGPGAASREARRAAFDNAGVDTRARDLVDTVARHAWKVTDADVAATMGAGLSEDEIFELAVCAALGHSTRQLRAALAALDAATLPVDGAGIPAADRGAGETR